MKTSQGVRPTRKERRAYVAPRLTSSDAFERFAAACTGLNPLSNTQEQKFGAGGTCQSPQGAS
jgi:hypothetical protein